MRRVLGPIVAAAVMLATPAAAAARPLKSSLTIGADGAKVTFYDAECSDHPECQVANMGCDADGNLVANVGGVQQRDISIWFAKSNGIATMAVGW